MLDLVSAIEHALEKKAKIREVPIQPGDGPRTWADRTALREELGHTVHTSIIEGVTRFVDWYRRNSQQAGAPYPDAAALVTARPDHPPTK